MCQDAKVHGHIVEMMFIKEHGGLTQDDSKFLDHKKAGNLALSFGNVFHLC